MLDFPSHWEGICTLKPVQALCSLQSMFCSLFSFYTLRWAESHEQFSALHAGLASSGKHQSLLIISGKAYYTTTIQWSTGIAVYLKQSSPFSPLCVKINSAFLMIIAAYSLHLSLSSSLLPISSKSSKLVVRLNVPKINAPVFFSWEKHLKTIHRKSKLSLLKINMQVISPAKTQSVYLHFVRSLLSLF